MKRRFALFFGLLFFGTGTFSQSGQNTYRALIHRPDGHTIPFNIDVKQNGSQTEWTIINGKERIPLRNFRIAADSLFVDFPVFESQIHLSLKNKEKLEGYWFKGSGTGYNLQSISVFPDQGYRFKGSSSHPSRNISGRWAVQFIKEDQTSRPAVAEFSQNGDKLTGTFLNRSGDYRYLDGIVSGDSLYLSTFDGSHAFYFSASIESNDQISGGLFCSGTSRKESWSATRDPKAKLPPDPNVLAVRNQDEPLVFSLPDLNGKLISIRDSQFLNKPVIIQLMGSWCSNCMDETAFLSELYKKYQSKGLVMLALAYEYSTDVERSRKSLEKFKERFHMNYPILITGVTASDPKLTEKTLPQLKKIESFPTTIILDRTGKVFKIHTGFNGPATGSHYEEEKKYFQDAIEELLN
ncbi:MAG: TlpA family protein disulfide reductase [Bacteroidetes bacterium]|nr:MAG: TlpA family protein disulfide reductase [Bacteroidota bacterium]